MAINLSGTLTTNTFGFNVPCRQFIIGAQVTRDKRMPVVDEFVLRALRVCERVPESRLSAYFGFTKGELQTVLADLAARTLIVMDKNDVLLHPSAAEMFRTSAPDTATIMEVDDWVAWLWFDLISQNMINPQGLRRGKNLIEIRVPVAERTLAEDFAREAFQSNFKDYLRVVKKIYNPENLSLYAITDVQPGRFGFVPIAGKEELSFEAGPKLTTNVLEGYEERPQRLRLLTDAMSGALRDLGFAEASAAARSDFERLSGAVFGSAWSGDALDLPRWIEHQGDAEGEQQSITLVGAAYVEANRRAFCTMLAASGALERITDRSSLEVVWFRPAGRAWGVSDDLRLMLADVRATVRKVCGADAALGSCLVVPAALRGDKPRRFDRIFSRAVVAPPGFLSPALELILLPGVAAIVLITARLSERVSVLVGKATCRIEDVVRIEQRWHASQDKMQPLWSSARTSATEEIV